MCGKENVCQLVDQENQTVDLLSRSHQDSFNSYSLQREQIIMFNILREINNNNNAYKNGSNIQNQTEQLLGFESIVNGSMNLHGNY